MNAPTRKIRWAVLGYARIARVKLIPAMRRAANAEFYALASRDEFPTRFSIPPAH